MLKNEHVKMRWDFEYNMRKESTARWSDVTIEYMERKVVHLVDMVCPSEKNVLEKITKKDRCISSSPLRLKRDRVEVIPRVIGGMGGGVGVMREQVRKIFIYSDTDKVCREMLKTASMKSESILRKVITNIATGDKEK